jgi:hypothetical protein
MTAPAQTPGAVMNGTVVDLSEAAASIAPSYSSGNIGDGSAGVITGIANNRNCKLALKFLF